MQIYLAARYRRMVELRSYHDDLENMGHVVTSRWITGAHDALDASSAAREDRDDLLAADCVISFTEEPESHYGRGGRHVEFGMAMATGKRVLVVGYRENVFHHLPEVQFFGTWPDARLSLMPKLDPKFLGIEPIDLDDRVDGTEAPLPEGVRRLSPKARLQLWKIGVRQICLASRFLRRRV